MLVLELYYALRIVLFGTTITETKSILVKLLLILKIKECSN